MTILPVLDLMQGVVVRGVAGRREEYRPVCSELTASAEPSAVADAFRQRLGLHELYIADLDAILQDRLRADVYRSLAGEGFVLRVDAGLRAAARGHELFDAGVQCIIAGLETLTGPRHLEALLAELGADRITFSLDLRDGRLMTEPETWETADPLEAVRIAVQLGVRSLIILDIAQVGLGAGIAHLPLLRQCRECFPELELITGGGVRSVADLHRLEALGVDAALAASALHNGAITAEDLRPFATGRR